MVIAMTLVVIIYEILSRNLQSETNITYLIIVIIISSQLCCNPTRVLCKPEQNQCVPTSGMLCTVKVPNLCQRAIVTCALGNHVPCTHHAMIAVYFLARLTSELEGSEWAASWRKASHYTLDTALRVLEVVAKRGPL